MSCYESNPVDAIAGTTVVLLARLLSIDDGTTAITTSDVNSIRVDVYSDGVTVDGDGAEITDGTAYDTPVKTDVITAMVTSDAARWTKDSEGYDASYKFTVPSVSGVTYMVVMKVTTTDGDVLGAYWPVNAI